VRRREERLRRELRVHQREQARRRVARRLLLQPPEQHRDARRGRPVGQRPRRDAEPALHARRTDRVARQPLPAGIRAQRQVDEDRVAVGEHHLAVLDHRQLTERVQRQKRRGLVFAAQQVDRDLLERQTEQRQEQLDAVHVHGQRMAVQTDGAPRRGGSSGIRHGRPRGTKWPAA